MEFQIIEYWYDMEVIVKIPVTIAVQTEEGSRFYLKLDEGKYRITRGCEYET